MNRSGTDSTQPLLTRRSALLVGGVGLLGLGLPATHCLAESSRTRPKRSVIFIFLTGGLSHQDSFDMKPDAPEEVRGEFHPIATRTPGLRICEHLPRLAQRSDRFALVRSVGTGSSGHEEACHMLLTGRLDMPAGFNLNTVPNANEWPSLAALVTALTQGRNGLPSAVVLPQPSVNEAGRVRPGQFAGRLGANTDAWHLDVAAKCALGNGACPHCFRFEGAPFRHAAATIFEAPMVALPEGGQARLHERLTLLARMQELPSRQANAEMMDSKDRHHRQAATILANPRVRSAFEVESADARTLERYGKNKFGLSLLMAQRLVEAGVSFVQVNLGKNSSWDTHNRNFVNLRDNLLPYLDRGVSALVDDLQASGRLDETLVVMTGEFGRTPRINKNGGRDHWGPAMTVFFAGGGVHGGNVIGATDNIAAYPISDRQTPENVAATIYQALGIPRSTAWRDVDGRPYELYCAAPIPGLMA